METRAELRTTTQETKRRVGYTGCTNFNEAKTDTEGTATLNNLNNATERT